MTRDNRSADVARLAAEIREDYARTREEARELGRQLDASTRPAARVEPSSTSIAANTGRRP